MSIYTVYEPPLKAHESAPAPERFVFVRDGFSFWAFLLAPLWMLRHRLWLAFTGYVIVAIGLQVALRLVGASTGVTVTVAALLSLLVGFEAATLRRFTLSRRGWKNVGIVVGDDLESAERRFFDGLSLDSRHQRFHVGMAAIGIAVFILVSRLFPVVAVEGARARSAQASAQVPRRSVVLPRKFRVGVIIALPLQTVRVGPCLIWLPSIRCRCLRQAGRNAPVEARHSRSRFRCGSLL